jgi:V8-like Glu-specific endopeptidase
MRKHVLRFLLLLLAVAAEIGQASRIPPSWLNAVVAIGHTERSPDGSVIWATEASGFFYGYLIHDDPDAAKRLYDVFLITNRHVIANHAQIAIRLNPRKTSDQGEFFDIPTIDAATGRPTWFTHKDGTVDVAAARVNWQFLQTRGIEVEFLCSDTNSADTRKMKEIGVSAGDSIFVLGFPMNLAGKQRNYAIVRPGAIARVTDLIESAATTLLIDSHVFPGNSGGPVILEPSIMSITGTKSNNMAYLIGIATAYIPYIDVAVSPQTQHARVTFEENSGLAEVIPVDRINEAIKTWSDSLPASPPAPLKPAPAKQ